MVGELNSPYLMAFNRISDPPPRLIKFEIQDLATRALIPSVVFDEPQIYPDRSAAVDETERMSTPTEESVYLLTKNIWKHQTECILAVLLSHEREKSKKYLQAYRHFMRWSAWKGRQSSTTKHCGKPRQEIRKVLFRNCKLHEVKDDHCNCTSHNEPTSRVG